MGEALSHVSRALQLLHMEEHEDHWQVDQLASAVEGSAISLVIENSDKTKVDEMSDLNTIG